MFQVTPSLVLYWWRILNEAIFDGQLKPPHKVYIRKFVRQDIWGTCQGWGASKLLPVVFEMKEEYDDKEMFIAVLAHEMVHQWEQQTFGRMTHGKNFFAWADNLKRVGLPLDKAY